ncbi:hypothetical protein [Streptomyces sp. NBC_01264]|nr:hypothetical protein [Streptomyces sp. NBC_01264]MCX4783766.1 hypothetical protein [Streptomyces sp. NBC_01264]
MNIEAKPWTRPASPRGPEGWLDSLRDLLVIPPELRDEGIFTDDVLPRS